MGADLPYCRALAYAGLAVGLCACGEVSGLPSADPVALLQGMLTLGEPRHMLQVEWSSPTDVSYDPTPRPVAADQVDLWILGPAGDSAAYIPTALPGQFAVVATVRAGDRYRLGGTVAGSPVSAEVQIPGTLLVDQPAGDTLRFNLDERLPDVPFVWRAESAGSYQALLVDAEGTSRSAHILRPNNSMQVFDIAPDTIGQLQLLPLPHGNPYTERLVLLGYDRTATAFFSSTTKGNVHGAFGLFGAAAKVEKVVVWE